MTLDSNSEDDHALFAFSVIDGIPTIWTDQIITVSITIFINETLEVYNAQLSPERQAAEVNRSLIELLTESPRTSTLDGYPQDQSFEDPPVYSQGTTFSNESASNTIRTDDGQQTLQFTKENNGQISNSSINTSGVSAFQITRRVMLIHVGCSCFKVQ